MLLEGLQIDSGEYGECELWDTMEDELFWSVFGV